MVSVALAQVETPEGTSMPARSRTIRCTGPIFVLVLALAFVHPVLADELFRCIGFDDATRTSAAVVVDAALPLAHTTQILPLDDQGRIISAGRAEKQASAVFDQLERALGEVHSSRSLLVKLNVYAALPEVIPAVKAVLARRLPEGGQSGPAISFVVGDLPDPEALVAIDAVAVALEPAGSRAVSRFRIASLAGQRTGGHVALLPDGGRVYVSGQADPGADLAQATRRTLEGLAKTLEHLGLDRSRVVQIKAFLAPMTAASEVERVVTEFFGAGAVPPLSLVEWRSSTPPIEIELIAAARRPSAQDKEPETVEFLTPPALKPSPIFSRVARVNRGDLIYISGLYGPEQASGADQVKSIFDALGTVLTRAGSDFRHLVKATYYVSDDPASRALNELRPRYYDPARPPAASKALVPGVGADGRSITVDMIAVPKPGTPRP
jgi:enamine deaminase RidA (YjgF/YER057c/UK114 family)